MSAHGIDFLDTNVLLYLLDEKTRKAEQAEKVLTKRAVISVQVLSEFTAVARRKLAFTRDEIEETVRVFRRICKVEPMTVKTFEDACRLAERYRLSWYDAMITASALRAGCTTLYTEDFQHGQVIERKLKVVNPFV